MPSTMPIAVSARPSPSRSANRRAGEAPSSRISASSRRRSESAWNSATNTDSAAVASSSTPKARNPSMPTPARRNSRADSKAGEAACSRSDALIARGSVAAASGDA